MNCDIADCCRQCLLYESLLKVSKYVSTAYSILRLNVARYHMIIIGDICNLPLYSSVLNSASNCRRISEQHLLKSADNDFVMLYAARLLQF